MSKNTRTTSAPSSAAEKLLHPVGTVRTTVSHLPGAATATGAFDTVLDTVGSLSPRSRRIAVYTGAGLLGAVGVVEWPVAAAGAAVVWLTQSRPEESPAPTARRRTRAEASRPASRRSTERGAATKPRTTKSSSRRHAGS